jgi:3-phenylpropionate/trans-cinnamate dioxygenase ferredoxin reductase subunit
MIDMVIVGAGQAGGDLACALRQQGFGGTVTLIGEELHPPYRRPPLSKTFLSGEATLESLYLRAPDTYVEQRIECRLGVGVESIDRQVHSLRLFDGSELHYGKLVLATGGRPRTLSLTNAGYPNVHYIRTIDDIQRLRSYFRAGARLGVIGGGYIGLEAASIGSKMGLDVTLIEALPRVLARVAGPELSAFYERIHRAHGVRILTGIGVHSLEGDGHVDTLVLSDENRLPVDLLIVGIGLIPNTELAEAAGLQIANGIAVGPDMRTSDPHIFAIGDCCSHQNTFLERRVRLESVSSVAEQARITAAVLCGKPVPPAGVPWFWSDQYDLRLQIVGLSEGYDQLVVRGDLSTTSFSLFYLKGGLVICADTVNRPAEFAVAKKLVAGRTPVAAARLADESVPLKALVGR